jgi:hypothetical protein
MTTAEELFTETFRRFNNNWNVILSLRQFLSATGSVAPLALKEYHAGIMDVASTDSDFRKIFGDANTPTNPEVLAFLQTQMTELVLNNAAKAIDAASLVFAQIHYRRRGVVLSQSIPMTACAFWPARPSDK